MFDGRIENLPALVGLAAALPLAGLAALIALRAPPAPSRSANGVVAATMVGATWLALIPLNILHKAREGGLPAVFGREGADAGLIEALTVAAWAACVLLFARAALGEKGLLRAVMAVGGLTAFFLLGEEISWGQWLWHWATPEAFNANLQGETNAHNYLGPHFYDAAYRIAGAGIVMGSLAVVAFPQLIRQPDFARLTAFLRTRWGLPLTLLAGALMQHPMFQELCEAVLAAAVACVLLAMPRREFMRAEAPRSSPKLGRSMNAG